MSDSRNHQHQLQGSGFGLIGVYPLLSIPPVNLPREIHVRSEEYPELIRYIMGPARRVWPMLTRPTRVIRLSSSRFTDSPNISP